MPFLIKLLNFEVSHLKKQLIFYAVTASRAGMTQQPPPYVPPPHSFQPAAPPMYTPPPQGYGFQLPTNTFPSAPPGK